jgi:hypothetical protein
VLGEQAAKLGEILRWVVEGAKDLLALGDGQRDSDAIRVEGVSQRGRGRLIDKVSKPVDELGRQRDVGDDEQLRLDRTALHATLVLGEKHATQLREADGRIVEHSQNRLTIGNRECEEILLGVQPDKEPAANKSRARSATFSSRTATRRGGPRNACVA